MILAAYFTVNMLISGFLLFGFCLNAAKVGLRMDRYDAGCGLMVFVYHALSWYYLIK